MKKKEKNFVGEFKELLDSFVNQKRTLGYKYDAIRDILYRFSQFTLDYTIKNNSLSKDLVQAWATHRKNESDKTWGHRTSAVRQFALYLLNIGYYAFIPKKCHKVGRYEFIPYIFTHAEINSFILVVDSIEPHLLSNKDTSYPLLFRLLYCCGFRISELLHLKISDVDLERGTLLVRESKFCKDRIIPLSLSLVEMCVKYQNLFNQRNSPHDYFFRNKNGTPLTHDTVYKAFRKLLWKSGISHGGKGKGPRLHDLRHTFCVHTLAKQVKDGVDLYVAHPILSTYLGHSSIVATQHYLRLTIDAYPELIKKVSMTCAHVFPEVTKNEIN